MPNPVLAEALDALPSPPDEASAGDRAPSSRSAEGFATSYRRFRERWDLAALDFDPQELLAGARDRGPGRDFSW